MATIAVGRHDPRARIKALVDKHEAITDYSIETHITLELDNRPEVRTVITIEGILTDALLPDPAP